MPLLCLPPGGSLDSAIPDPQTENVQTGRDAGPYPKWKIFEKCANGAKILPRGLLLSPFFVIIISVVNMENNLPKRKTMRSKYFDYNSSGIYFLTICTQHRQCLLSRVVGTGVPDGPQIRLTKYGEIADRVISQLNDFYEYLSVEDYVIMPNHMHILLRVWGEGQGGPSGTPVPTDMNGPSGTPVPTDMNGPSRTPVPTDMNGPSGTPVPTMQNSAVAKFLSTFKRFCNKEYEKNIWQSRAYDHVIRNRQDYEEHIKYIHENPAQWYYDELYAPQ